MGSTEDTKIIELYFRRDEQAIAETNRKYGRSCHSVAYRILGNAQDAEECTNDTWVHAWNAIPPDRPANLFAYLIVIVRHIALDLYKQATRKKRGGGQTTLALEELADCIPADESVEQSIDHRMLRARIERFLETLSQRDRILFVQRYTYLMSVQEIATANGMTVSNTKVTLMRTRKALRNVLEQEGML